MKPGSWTFSNLVERTPSVQQVVQTVGSWLVADLDGVVRPDSKEVREGVTIDPTNEDTGEMHPVAPHVCRVQEEIPNSKGTANFLIKWEGAKAQAVSGKHQSEFSFSSRLLISPLGELGGLPDRVLMNRTGSLINQRARLSKANMTGIDQPVADWIRPAEVMTPSRSTPIKDKDVKDKTLGEYSEGGTMQPASRLFQFLFRLPFLHH